MCLTELHIFLITGSWWYQEEKEGRPQLAQEHPLSCLGTSWGHLIYLEEEKEEELIGFTSSKIKCLCFVIHKHPVECSHFFISHEPDFSSLAWSNITWSTFHPVTRVSSSSLRTGPGHCSFPNGGSNVPCITLPHQTSRPLFGFHLFPLPVFYFWRLFLKAARPSHLLQICYACKIVHA